MLEDHWIRASILGILGLFIAWYLFVQNRHALASLVRHAAMWVFIFLSIIVGYGLWSDGELSGLPKRAVFSEEGRVEVARDFSGHYNVVMQINGVSVPFVVDTGATDMVLSRQDAERVGIDLERLVYTGRANTANGSVETAQVRLEDVRLGDIHDQNVPAIVNNGDMAGSLLGMSYLSHFSRIAIENNRLVLER